MKDTLMNHNLARGVAMLAAALMGLGAIFWIAANWDTLGRLGRFGLLEATLVVAGLGAMLLPVWRAPLALLVFLITGGLFASIGQTYQTGADPWQLFALWAALGLPLAWVARHDALWAPWVLVFTTALSLWVQTQTGGDWRLRDQDMWVHLMSWALLLGITAGLSAPARAWTGAGVWSWRLAVTLSAMSITFVALTSLFDKTLSSLYPMGLVVIGGGALLLSQARAFDLYGLSVLSLGLNILLVCGLGRLMLRASFGDDLMSWLLLGLIAAGLLAMTVTWVLKLSHRHGSAALTEGGVA